MSVSNQVVYQQYVCNGAIQTFAIPFAYVSADQVTVYLIDTTLNIDVDGNVLAETKTLLVNPGDYVINGLGTSIITTLAYAGNFVIRVERSTAIVQDASYIQDGAFPAATHEAALDKRAYIEQENRAKDARQVILSDLTPSNFNPQLPTLAPNVVIATNPSGTGFMRGPDVSQIYAAVDAAAEAAASAAAAAASALAAAASEAEALQHLNDVLAIYNEAIGNIEAAEAAALANITQLANDSIAEITLTYLNGIEDINFAIVAGVNTINIALGQALTDIYLAQNNAVAEINALVAQAQMYAQQALAAVQDVEAVYDDLANLLAMLPPQPGSALGGGGNSSGIHYQEYIDQDDQGGGGFYDHRYPGLTQPIAFNNPLALYVNGNFYFNENGAKYAWILVNGGSKSHVVFQTANLPAAGQEIVGMHVQSTDGLQMPIETIGVGDGVQTTWPLGDVAKDPAFVSVYLNGRKLHDDRYSATANDITFVIPPTAAQSIAVKYEKDVPSLFRYRFEEPAQTPDGSTSLFGNLLFRPADKDSVIVSLNGAAIPKGWYDVIGLDVVFKPDFIPASGQSLCVEYFYTI